MARLERVPVFERNPHRPPPSPAAAEKKVWLNYGNVFLKLPKEAAEEQIEAEQASLTAEITALRETIAAKAGELRRGEGQTVSKGWDLKPSKPAEMGL